MTVVADREGVDAKRDTSLAKLCTQLINIEEDFDAGVRAAREHIILCDEVFGEASVGWKSKLLAGGSSDAEGLIKQLLSLAPDAGNATPKTELSAHERCFILTQYAPQALLSGCVLQNIANASSCHEPVSTFAHSIHSWHVGGGIYESNHAVQYRHLLEGLNVSLPSIRSSRFSDCAQLLPKSWSLTAYRLSLSIFPREYQAEILGAALLEIVVAIPAVVLNARVSGDISEWKYALEFQSARLEQTLDFAKAAIAEAIRSEHAGNDTPLRIIKGFMISLELLNTWSSEVSSCIRGGHLVPMQAMVRMVRKKAKYAVGYHGRVKLANQSFDKLIVQDPERFVQQLGQSRWVSPGQPELSLLLNQYIEFGGPMFRVFSDAEIDVIRRWINSLADTNVFQNKLPTVPVSRDAQQVCMPQSKYKVEQNQRRCKSADLREMYYRLLNIDRYPEVRSEALEYGNTWLARSASSSARRGNALPFEKYTHEELRAWFEAKALAQAQSYCINTENIKKTRSEVIDEALQLCPMTLIDGAWLQRWGNVGIVESKIGALLYKIFSDEIGNGDVRLNHPNIYRQLLQQMGIDLPDFRTREFAYFEQFDNAAFLVPVFWLSLSQFPLRFLPETLGLNLAMELSGVGGSYRTARDELRHYGFSALFVDLHNTIDNVSSGHSAMAVEAIELYMDDFLNGCTPALVATQWSRVWTGFCALSTPKSQWLDWLYPIYRHPYF